MGLPAEEIHGGDPLSGGAAEPVVAIAEAALTISEPVDVDDLPDHGLESIMGGRARHGETRGPG
jgi:hypothetical protein